MSSSSASSRDRPEAPAEIRRAMVLGRFERCGLGVLLAIPALALAGWLGDRRASQTAVGTDFTMNVDYPTQGRVGHALLLTTRVTGDGISPGRPVTVEVSSEYLESFAPVVSRPAFSEVRTGAALIRHEGDAGSAGIEIVLELTPRKLGRAPGWIRVVSDSGERTEVAWDTWVLP